MKYCLSLLGLLWLLVACKPKQQSLNPNPSSNTQALQSLPLDSLLGKPQPWEWMESKFNAEIRNQDKQYSAKGRIRMRKDSLIWISIKPDIALFEVFRLLILSDSTQVLDLLNKKYFFGSNKELSHISGIPFELLPLQEALLGRPFLSEKPIHYQTGANLSGAWAATQGAEAMFQEPKLILPGQFIQFFSPGFVNYMILGNPRQQQRANIRVESFTTEQNYLVPKVLSIEAFSPENSLRISLDFNKFSFNEPMSFPFTVPDSYPRRRLEDLNKNP